MKYIKSKTAGLKMQKLIKKNMKKMYHESISKNDIFGPSKGKELIGLNLVTRKLKIFYIAKRKLKLNGSMMAQQTYLIIA